MQNSKYNYAALAYNVGFWLNVINVFRKIKLLYSTLIIKYFYEYYFTPLLKKLRYLEYDLKNFHDFEMGTFSCKIIFKFPFFSWHYLKKVQSIMLNCYQ